MTGGEGGARKEASDVRELARALGVAVRPGEDRGSALARCSLAAQTRRDDLLEVLYDLERTAAGVGPRTSWGEHRALCGLWASRVRRALGLPGGEAVSAGLRDDSVSGPDALRELRAWAEATEGGYRALRSISESVPFVARALERERRARLRARVDARATRAHEPWTPLEDRRLADAMRRGECAERVALELSRRVAAVEARKVKVRMSMPASSWRRGGEDA